MKKSRRVEKDIFEEASQFFTLNPDGTVTHEISFNEELFSSLSENEYEADLGARAKKYFEPGNAPNDPLVDYIRPGETYQAVVTKVVNSQRMVYVSIGRAKGMIPYEGFRWAHERSISDERKFFPYVTHPSRILKRGDVVLVSVLSSPRSPGESLIMGSNQGPETKNWYQR